MSYEVISLDGGDVKMRAALKRELENFREDIWPEPPEMLEALFKEIAYYEVDPSKTLRGHFERIGDHVTAYVTRNKELDLRSAVAGHKAAVRNANKSDVERPGPVQTAPQ